MSRLVEIDKELCIPGLMADKRILLLEEKVNLLANPQNDRDDHDLNDLEFQAKFGRERTSTENISAGLRARKVLKDLAKYKR